MDIETAYEYLKSQETNAEHEKRYVEERSLDLLPRLIDQLCLPAISTVPPGLYEQSSYVLDYLFGHASPKEMSLSLETELERAIDEIAECFITEEEYEDKQQESGDREESTVQLEVAPKTLESASKRICVALESHIHGRVDKTFSNLVKLTIHSSPVLDRLAFKKGKAGILVIQSFLERLDDFLAELSQAMNTGEPLPSSSSMDLCTAVAAWCQHAYSWASTLTLSSEESDDVRDALEKMGMPPNSYSRWMCSEDQRIFGNRLVFFPIAALILTTWKLVDELESDPASRTEPSESPAYDDPAAILSMSMPLLGSALNGLAKDGGHLWIWYLVNRMERAQQSADADEVSMLLELIMPNLAGDPSEASRYALYRLTSALISLVPKAEDRIVLFQQLISPDNSFLSVRLSILALLREEVSAAIRLRKTDSIVHHGNFWSDLAPHLFVFPKSDLPLQELPLDTVLEDRIIPWAMECAKIMLILLSCGPEAEDVS
ncbi:hypothetical protein QFC19_006321 [Naganishia cerealis]|uniref:Uncharacterized protein n=1 Tax=Naganishia cerealis TaxID=610337 RepID=A0ACC2VHK6_9TREE|nr:hypothetical protein QFC19_006321 [Naganishia cerealis]